MGMESGTIQMVQPNDIVVNRSNDDTSIDII